MEKMKNPVKSQVFRLIKKQKNQKNENTDLPDRCIC